MKLDSITGNVLWMVAASLLLAASGNASDRAQPPAARHIREHSTLEREGGFLPFSRDSLNLRVVGRWACGPAGAVMADTARAVTFLGAGGGVVILDMSDPRNPAKLSELSTPGYVRDLVRAGDHLYAADDQGGLRIISVADPGNPVEVGHLDTSHRTRGLAVRDSLALTADDAGGVRVISVSDPSNPVEIGACQAPDSARSVAMEGSHAYVAASGAGMRVVSLENPAEPVEVGFFETSANAVDVTVSGSQAFLLDGAGLHVLSVTDPVNPSEIGYCGVTGSVKDVKVWGAYAYVSAWQGGVHIISVSDPANPVTVATYLPPSFAVASAMVGSNLQVAGYYAGLRVVDLTDPGHPAEIGDFATPGWSTDIAVQDSIAYVANGEGGLRIISCSDPANPREIGNHDTPGEVEAVAVGGSFAYLADFMEGLRAVSVADPKNPVEVDFLPSVFALDVAVNGSHAYLLDEIGGLKIISIDDPAHLAEVGSFLPSGLAGALAVAGPFAYLTQFSPAAMWVVSVDPPEFPFELGSYDCGSPGSWAWDVDAEDSYAYLTDTRQGLHIVSISETGTPTGAGLFGIDGYAMGVDALGSMACVADNFFGLRVVDASDPEHPAQVGYYQTSWGPESVAVRDSLIYLTMGTAGIMILKYDGPTSIEGPETVSPSLPRAFSLSQNHPNPFNPVTTISFEVPGLVESGRKRALLEVYDLRGRLVKRLLEADLEPGAHSITWEGRDSRGHEVPSGIYFFTLKCGDRTSTRKMTVAR